MDEKGILNNITIMRFYVKTLYIYTYIYSQILIITLVRKPLHASFNVQRYVLLINYK